MEDVNNKIYEIQQRPPPGHHTLHVVRTTSAAFEGLNDVFGHRADVRVGRPGRYDEEVRRIAQVTQVEHGNLEGLVLVERFDCQPQVAALFGCYSRAVANGSASVEVKDPRSGRICPTPRDRHAHLVPR